MYGTDLSSIHHAGFGGFAAEVAPGLLKELHRAGIKSGLIVDLGCGSGIWLREVTRAGFRAFGIDRSAAMVRIARKVAPAATFRIASLGFSPLPRCEAVTAIGEVLSYRAAKGRPRSMRSILREVASALRPGGLFLFDLLVISGGSPLCYRTWSASRDWAVLVEASEDPRNRRLRREITTFVRDGGRFRRKSECHTLEIADPDEVVAQLHDLGFTVQVSRHYGRLKLPPRRLAFIARRR